MPTTKETCVNYEINVQQCPCPNEDCERHAICCECVKQHASKGKPTMCMSDTDRPAQTRSLPIGANTDCPSRERNEDRCPCGETACTRHALCCDCIRFHWGHKAWPKVACL